MVQVFWAESPSYNRWTKRWCGVATFVKDNNKRSYYIRIFDLKVLLLLMHFNLRVRLDKFEFLLCNSYVHGIWHVLSQYTCVPMPSVNMCILILRSEPLIRQSLLSLTHD